MLLINVDVTHLLVPPPPLFPVLIVIVNLLDISTIYVSPKKTFVGRVKSTTHASRPSMTCMFPFPHQQITSLDTPYCLSLPPPPLSSHRHAFSRPFIGPAPAKADPRWKKRGTESQEPLPPPDECTQPHQPFRTSKAADSTARSAIFGSGD